MQTNPQALLAAILVRAEVEILHPFLAGYLRLGLAPIRHPDPVQALLAEAGRFVGWTSGRAAEDRAPNPTEIGDALQALATALSQADSADDSPAFALGVVRGRQIVFGLGRAFGQTIDGSTTRQDLGGAVREIDARRHASVARLLRGTDLLAETVLHEDGHLTRRLPTDATDATDARACALLLARGIWGGRADSATEAALAHLPRVPPLPMA